jgi:peroxiredoxin
MKKTLLFGLAAITLAACNNNVDPGQVQLNISSPGEDTLIISRLAPNAVQAIDTLTSVDGKFTTTITTDSADFFMVAGGDYSAPLFSPGGENIQLDFKADGQALRGKPYEVSGSPESERIKLINDLVMESANYIDSLGEVFQQYRDSANAGDKRRDLEAEFEAEVERAREKLMALIDEKPGMMANLFIWPQTLGQFQLITAEEHFEYYQKVDSALEQSYPGNPHARFFKDQLVKIEQQLAQQKAAQAVQNRLQPGNPMPDIALPNPAGDTIKLSSLKGQIVLVDFWAAWCKPCRMANPTIVKAYEKYKDRGFTVYSVSLDGLPQQTEPKKEWQTAIMKDQLSWDNHVSDLMGWRSSVVPQFGIQGIPFTILVDRDGTIATTRLRPDEIGNWIEKLEAERAQ